MRRGRKGSGSKVSEKVNEVPPQDPPRRSRKGRWEYMKAPGYNPPTNRCMEEEAGCTGPSKTFFIGAKSVFSEDGTMLGSQQRWKCEHDHEWTHMIPPR